MSSFIRCTVWMSDPLLYSRRNTEAIFAGAADLPSLIGQLAGLAPRRPRAAAIPLPTVTDLITIPDPDMTLATYPSSLTEIQEENQNGTAAST
jgi:hypothetical protein